jgi:D-3-phosphoglycerate dehydrogenase
MTTHKVIVTEPIHQAGIELLEMNGIEVVQLPVGSDEETIQAEAPWAAALITRGGIKITRGFMESAPMLKAVGVHGIGCDHVDLKAASDLGKVVLNTPFALSESVAEMTIALLFAISRRVVSADKAVRAGEWYRKYGDLRGIEVRGKTVGVVGLGRIGAAIVRSPRCSHRAERHHQPQPSIHPGEPPPHRREADSGDERWCLLSEHL